jgi:hypothetical protein
MSTRRRSRSLDDFRNACASAGVRHLRTPALHAPHQREAERFLPTVMRECAYARAFRSSRQRAAALPRWLHVYNVHRPHTAIAGQPAISRLPMTACLVTSPSAAGARHVHAPRAG